MEGEAPNLEELQLNLRQQLTLYRRLVDLLREERQHLVAVQLKEIREATYSKEALLDEIQRQEFRRVRWQRQCAAFLKISEKDLTIEVAAVRVGGPEQFEPFASLKNTLLHMVRKARELNEENKRLVANALKDAQELKKNVLGLSSGQAQVYGPRGTMGGSTPDQSSRFLDKGL